MTGEEFSHNARAHEEEEENNSCSRKSNGSYGVEFISSGKVSSSLCLTAPLPFFSPSSSSLTQDTQSALCSSPVGHP